MPEVPPFKFTAYTPPEPHLPDAQGGALVNLIHSYTDNGDPFVRKFTDQLLEEVCPLPFVRKLAPTPNRYRNPSFPPSTNGSFQANSTIPTTSFLFL